MTPKHVDILAFSEKHIIDGNGIIFGMLKGVLSIAKLVLKIHSLGYQSM
jgi:hypothetical protein